MRVINTRIGKKTLVIKDCKGFSSIKGLMFDALSDCDGALIYSNSIWMPFVKHELDLIFLGKNFKIIEIQHAVPLTLNPVTWKIYKNEKAKYCLEIKSGAVRNLKALIGKKTCIEGKVHTAAECKGEPRFVAYFDSICIGRRFRRIF